MIIAKKNKGFLFTILFLLSPVFISFGNGEIGFDRVGGIASEYIISIPIGVIMVLLIAIPRLLAINYVNTLIISTLVLLSLIFNYVYHQQIDFSKIRTGSYMIFFMFALGVFDAYFKSIISLDPYRIISYIRKSVIVIILVVISSGIIFEKDVFLFPFIRIYNFEQYLALFFIGFLGFFFEKNINNKLYYQAFYLAFTIHIATLSANYTAQVLCIFFTLIYILLYKNYIRVELTKVLIFFNVVLFSTSPFILFYSTYFINIQADNLLSRITTMSFLFENTNTLNFILPFLFEPRSFANDYHNEFLESLFAVGWIGVIVYYKIIVSRILVISKVMPYVAVSLSTLIFIGGFVVENTHHPFMAISVALSLSIFSLYAKKMRAIALFQSRWGS